MRKYLILTAIFYCGTLFSQIDMQGIDMQGIDMQKEIESVKQADIDFSNLSRQTDMREAFLAYVAEDGVQLKPYSMPIVGREAIKQGLGTDSIDFTLVWAPLYGDVSASGELGYTYGTWELTGKDEKGEVAVRKGTYVTVWKKDKGGTWKWVLDTGNPGLEPKKEK